MTTEGISILINELGGGGGCCDNRRYSILINKLGGGCRDNRRSFNTN